MVLLIVCRFGTVAGLFAGLEYNIEIVANGASGNSSPLIGKVTTKTASMLCVCVYVCMCVCVCVCVCLCVCVCVFISNYHDPTLFRCYF